MIWITNKDTFNINIYNYQLDILVCLNSSNTYGINSIQYETSDLLTNIAITSLTNETLFDYQYKLERTLALYILKLLTLSRKFTASRPVPTYLVL